MAALQVEIRFETQEDVSFLASNLHASTDDVVTFFVTSRPNGNGRIKPGEKHRREEVSSDDRARFVLTFPPKESPFSSPKLKSDDKGQIQAVVTTKERRAFHYTFEGSAHVRGQLVHIAVKGCPEIIIR
jgi:hypothetical protein